MTEQWYAIVFNQDRPIGVSPDLDQNWYKGQLYSTGTVVDRTSIPDFFDVVELAAKPGDDEQWDVELQQFIKRVN